jgi:MFS family permease
MGRSLSAGLRRWLPPGQATRRFLLVSLIDSVGTGLFLAGSALFFTRVVGLSTAQMGVALSAAGITGFLFAVPVGRLADRIGSRRALIALQICRGAGFVAYLFVGDFATFFLVACLLGIGERTSGPITQTIIGSVEEGPSPVRTMAAMGVVRNVGFTFGAVLATLTIATNSDDGFRALVLANALSFFFAAAVLVRTRISGRASAGAAAPSESRMRVHDPRYLLLTALNGVLFLHTVLLAVGLPLWIVTHTAAPEPLIGVVVVVNTVLAVGLGVRLSRGVEGIREAAVRQHWAGWSLAACCVLIAPTGALGGLAASALLLVAAVVLTLGEIWQSLGAWGISYGLSPERERNYYLSVYNLGDTGATIIGPALITVGVMHAGAEGWLGLAAVFAATGPAIRVCARRAEAHGERHTAPVPLLSQAGG